MILSAIDSLKRSLRILDDLPINIKTEKTKILSELNDLFEDFRDKFDDNTDKETLKKITSFRLDIINKVEEFCNTILSNIEEDIQIVEK